MSRRICLFAVVLVASHVPLGAQADAQTCDTWQRLAPLQLALQVRRHLVCLCGRHTAWITRPRAVCLVRADQRALLARRAEQAGVVYSLAWGDQPALIAEHVDWARACGFKVICAGKGTRS